MNVSSPWTEPKPDLAFRVATCLRKQIAERCTLNAKRESYRARLKQTEFSLLTSNCIGGLVCHDLGLRFNSPTVNLFIPAADFLRMCGRLEHYMQITPRDAGRAEPGYPLLVLDDVAIHCVHYGSANDAIEKWERRKQRLMYDRLFITMLYRDGFTEDMLEPLAALPYPKVLFSHKPLPAYDFACYVPAFRRHSVLGEVTRYADLNGRRYYEKHFDLIEWLNGRSARECIRTIAPSFSPWEKAAYVMLRGLSTSKRLKRADDTCDSSLTEEAQSRSSHKFLELLEGRVDWRHQRILEVGCGAGHLALCLARGGAASVTGVDEDAKRIEAARRKAAEDFARNRVSFVAADFVREFHPDQPFDLVISKDAFEHILALDECLLKIGDCLKPGGRLVTKFGPLWHSPYGAHLQEMTPIPWVHLLFPERVALRIRTERYRPDDPAARYEDIEGHLNRLTVRRFLESATGAGFMVEDLRINPSLDRSVWRGINSLINRIPFLREAASHVIWAALRKTDGNMPSLPNTVKKKFETNSNDRLEIERLSY